MISCWIYLSQMTTLLLRLELMKYKVHFNLANNRLDLNTFTFLILSFGGKIVCFL